MTLYNILWFIAGVSCGYVTTLLLILIMTTPHRSERTLTPPPARDYSANGNGAHDEKFTR
jgi:hypothetical protein